MQTSYREGHFVWRELMTPDVEKAKKFYGELFGWTLKDVPMPSGTYTLIHKGDLQIAGMMQTPPGNPAPPAWMSYVSVPDVDAAVKAALAKGGNPIMPADDIAEVGRIAILMDSTGGVIGLMRASTGDPPAQARPDLGTFCWETLNTTNVDSAKDFYMAVAGWKPGAAPGNMLVMNAGETSVADFEPVQGGMPSHWLLHVVVDKLEAARAKAEGLGAKVLVPAVDIPHVGRISIVMDPVGAAFSLFEPDMSSAPPAA